MSHNANLNKMRHIHMQGLYTGCAEDVQAPNERMLDSVNILDDALLDARIIPSPDYERRSTSAWQAKLNAAPTAADNRRTIIQDWLDEIYDSDHAVFLFHLFKLHIGAYRGSSYDLMAHAAVDEFGYVRLPERVTAPIPSVSRSEPFSPVGGAI